MTALTSVGERDFGTFYLGDNPWALSDGMLRGMADRLGVRISNEQDPMAAEQLGEAIESRGNRAWSPLEVGRLIKYSGIHRSLDRSLANPMRRTPATALRVMVGAEAQQQDRVSDLLVKRAADASQAAVVVATGDRRLGSAYDFRNVNAEVPTGTLSRPSTETEYAQQFVVPKLRSPKAGYIADQHTFDTDRRSEVIHALAEQEPRLSVCNVAVVETSAVAGLQLAIELRTALRKQYPRFDHVDRNPPQLYAITDGRSIEVQEGQAQDACQTLLDIVTVAKALSEAALMDR